MRVETHEIGSIMHVVKRGARGMEITRDDDDRRRFVRTLYLLNDTHQDIEWTRNSPDLSMFERPEHWPEREPLVSVLAWTLMPNHFHILLCEIRDGGISKFMQRVCGSMTTRSNSKYDEQGSIFQGSYKARLVDTDAYLRYVFPYIVVKNVFELYPGGFQRAMHEFDEAWKFALAYPFSSFQSTVTKKESVIVDGKMLADLGLPGSNFKRVARDMLIAHASTREDFATVLLEPW